MAIENLAPCSGAHSVQSVVFALEWGTPLPNEALAEVRALYDVSDLKKQFPVPPQEQRAVSLRIDQNLGVPTGASISGRGGVAGYNFFKQLDPFSMARSLQVSEASFLYAIHDYTRWEKVLADVIQSLEIVSDPLLKSPISVIGLQYTDVFHWRDDPANLNLSEILSADGGLIPHHALTLPGLWHSHHGYFIDCEAPSPHRLLENVNIDILENGGQRSISIITSHRANLQKPIYDKAIFVETFKGFCQNLHDRNKSLLGNLLTSEVKKKIKLNGE